MCRQDFSLDYLDRPDLVATAGQQEPASGSTDAGEYRWFYKGRGGECRYRFFFRTRSNMLFEVELCAHLSLQPSPVLFVLSFRRCAYEWPTGGWWQYDSRTNDEIECAFNARQNQLEVAISGSNYIIDLVNSLQHRKDWPNMKREIKRDIRSGGGGSGDSRVKGVAGILHAGPGRSAYAPPLPETISDSDESIIDLT